MDVILREWPAEFENKPTTRKKIEREGAGNIAKQVNIAKVYPLAYEEAGK